MNNPMKQRPIRLLIVDDHEIVRAGLKTLFSHRPQLEVVGEAGSVGTAVAECIRLKPDLVLLDACLPDGTGADAIRQMRRMRLPAKIIVLTGFSDDRMVVECVTAGAEGFLLKEVAIDNLVHSIEQVHAGQSILDPQVTAAVMGRVRHPETGPTESSLTQLSPQESRILAHVAQGKTNKEIAAAMGLSDKTVKNYFSNVLEKLHLQRRSQAAAFYVTHNRDVKQTA